MHSAPAPPQPDPFASLLARFDACQSELITERAWRQSVEAERDALMTERDRLHDAVANVLDEWDVRGDGGCMRQIQDALRAAFGEPQESPT